jgi:hypothetical protein
MQRAAAALARLVGLPFAETDTSHAKFKLRSTAAAIAFVTMGSGIRI